MERKPVAFMSYAHFDDEHDGGRLTAMCKRLSGEVRVQTGEEFPIFQDRTDILWGQNWKARIEESLDAATFLIPIITPSFFKSDNCRDELRRFLEREKRLGRSDLILPIYYINYPLFNDDKSRAMDEMLKALAARQYADWRELRSKSLDTEEVRKTLEHLAVQIRNALQRVHMEENRITRPPTAQTKQQTLVVDSMCQGDYLTISEAIEAANPGSRILVLPGLYQEHVIIDKPLEIIGNGEVGDIVVQANWGCTLQFRAEKGLVAKLTLRVMEEHGLSSSVEIGQGQLRLEECDIGSQSMGGCVVIRGGADPRLRRNRIHSDRKGGCGIVVCENAQGILEDNDIFDLYAGVVTHTGGNPRLRHNRIHDSYQGVLVYDHGRGTLEEDNHIFDNDIGVEIKADGSLILHHNRIYKNRSKGVGIEGKGELADNYISGSDWDGVVIYTGGIATLHRNHINGNGRCAILLYDGAEGTIEDNDLRGNEKPWYISRGGDQYVKRARNLVE
jgi:parallel beta-helix repeat protein